MLNEFELTGRARTHVVQRDDLGAALHPAVLEPFLALREAAAREGIELAICSGFRDFAAQCRIWNLKFRGERPCYDARGNIRETATLGAGEMIDAILAWSALPGASRHHWGCDIDVIDRAALPPDYRVRLLPDEVEPGGVFHRLHLWLDENGARFGFFRPYREYRGGVYPEPWHLSYAAVAVPAMALLSEELIAAAIRTGDMLGAAAVLNRLPGIYRSHVVNVAEPDTATQLAAI
ncbi:MAG: M15 family metallopeptidase [Betaproteobacteria bacterium]|nr:M15 family metallopeptidase [Betaproteobacteria bacterium]MBI3053568.1 M15 family metallopeptidase [Betaproteobacteria bacterium]